MDLDAGQSSCFTQSCDTVVVLPDRTGGGVLLAKNSDRPTDEAQRLIGVSAADHPAGSLVHCQYLNVPQAAHTAALIGSQPFWLWGFEHGLNEHGVAIGNEAIFTREQPEEVGLLGMDLVRLGLERGTTARQALDAMTGLLERFGQGGSTVFAGRRFYDNSFLIADPEEAWILETAGRRWAARRLTSGAYAISNRPTLGTEYDLASPDLIAYAEERGWWPRNRRPFHFAEAYIDHEYGGLPGAECRLVRSRTHLAPGEQATLTAPALIDLLRDHGANPDGGELPLSWPTGLEAATICMHDSHKESATAASMVAELLPGALPRYWASMAPPCTGIFLPCWVDTGSPAILARAEGTATADSPWWRFRRLWQTVAESGDPGPLAGEVRAAWKAVEREIAERSAPLGAHGSAAARWEVSEWACGEVLRTLGQIETRLGINAE